jgi:hypothetical protein
VLGRLLGIARIASGALQQRDMLLLGRDLFGAVLWSIDVSMNIQEIIVERASGRSMMLGFHGLFSLGGIVGATGVTAPLGAGASPILLDPLGAAIQCGGCARLRWRVSNARPLDSRNDLVIGDIYHGLDARGNGAALDGHSPCRPR